MSTIHSESTGTDIIDEPFADTPSPLSELGTFEHARDTLLMWRCFKVGDTDSYAIADQLDALVKAASLDQY